MQRLLGYVRRACEDYNLIEDGDKIAVGVSGGKDSLVLLKSLCELKRFYKAKYELVAITLDMGFQGKPADYSLIKEMCDGYGVKYVVKQTEIAKIVFETRNEKSPCSLCARMRRGALHDAAIEEGCNKIALGHHYNDAVETFLMNLFIEGRIGCFSPLTYLSRKDLYMIRPLVYASEKEIEAAAVRLKLPVVKSACPADKHTMRQTVKQKLEDAEKQYPQITEKIFGALVRSKIDGWGRD